MKEKLTAILTVYILMQTLQTTAQTATIPDGYTSIYTEKIEDPLAVYFTKENFQSVNDGSQDVSDALQSAIDKVQETVRYGILFIPEGTYRISKTIYIWKGIRLIGYGKNRPVFLLAENTAGYREGKSKYMFHFCSDRPGRNRPIQDANAGTFYSGMRNINIKIEAGNPAAVGIRFHVAQHCFLSHLDFRLNDGNIGVEDAGNEIEYCRFMGGDYGIFTGKTAPGWQLLLMDSYFDGQKQAAVLTREAGLTAIRNHFKNTPSAITVKETYPEELWLSDSHFENISQTAIILSRENNPRTQVNLENIICIRVPQLVAFRETGEKINVPHRQYIVKTFTRGLQYAELGDSHATLQTTHVITPLIIPPPTPPSDVRLLPPVSTWVNIKSVGAKGDGETDDTRALQQAIADHPVIYLPSGHYRVTQPIILKENTTLIGLHPSITQIILKDSTPAYQGAGAPLPLLETPQGGTNIVTGIGLNTAGVNPRAVAAKWMAGAQSMLNDVRFVGGHGTHDLYGHDIPVYNDNRTADGLPFRTWDTQYWSLWITSGGGGTFKDIWTPSPYAAAGMYISNTTTEGRIYYMSSEHHVRNEIILNNISNWRFFGLQLEEESGEGPYCLPLDIKNSGNLLFANTFLYRVSRVTTPFPYAILTENVSDLTFKGIHNYSWTKYPFENTLYDRTHHSFVRPREIASLGISGKIPPTKEAQQTSPVIASGAKMTKLAGGFDHIDGATTDADGNVYFVDSKLRHIYCWNVNANKLSHVCDLPMNPVSLAIDKSGYLMVVTRFVPSPSIHTRGVTGVVSFDPRHPETTMITLKEDSLNKITGATTVYHQTSRHQNENDLGKALVNKVSTCYVSKDGSAVIPNTSDIGQTISLKPAVTGQTFYASTGPGQRTFRVRTLPDGSLAEPELFAETGAPDVATDKHGNIYIPSDHIRVFNPEGVQIETVETPERPSTIVFGGKDGNTLFICAHSSLYAIRVK